jgi:hypothetical protein
VGLVISKDGGGGGVLVQGMEDSGESVLGGCGFGWIVWVWYGWPGPRLL